MAPLNLRYYTGLANEALENCLPQARVHPGIIHEAMRYSIFAGGKRLRPALGFIAHEIFGGKPRDFMPAAAALECIHTYSLIHDDLPAMDDDDLRRGKPTSHRMYGEAVAILAGDALLTLAFELMTQRLVPVFSTARVLRATGELAAACGTYGLIGGQVVDVLSEGQEIPNPAETLSYIHSSKTGALITASLRTGALLAGATDGELGLLTRYGHYLGLAFQVRDDLLDVRGNASSLGKTPGKDQKNKKLTYVSLYGEEETAKRLSELYEQCLKAAGELPGRNLLAALARLSVERES